MIWMLAQASREGTTGGITTEGWLVIVTVILGVISVIQGVGLYWISTKTGKIDSLEKTVTDKAEEVVATRFQLLAVEFKGMVTSLQAMVDEMKGRLERGDGKFDEQGTAQHELEMKTVNREAGMKEWVHSHFGSRAEMTSVAERLAQLQLDMARFEQRLMHVEKGTRT